MERQPFPARDRHAAHCGRLYSFAGLQKKRNAQTDDYQNCFYPVLEFYTGGKLYKIRYPEGSLPSRFTVGQKVRIDFDPENPADFVIADAGMHQYLPEIIAGAGILLFLLGILIFLRFAVRG